LNRILVIRGGAIGDFILTLPAIRALRQAHPNAQIEILGYEQIAVLAENRFYAERVRSLESAQLSRFFADDAELPSDLANYFAGFDLIVSYLHDPDLIFESNLRRSGAGNIVRGSSKIEKGSPASHQLARPIRELGLAIPDLAPEIFLSAKDLRAAEEFIAGLKMPIVAFHPGSGSEKKNWPTQSWTELGNHFLGRFGGSLLIVSGEADGERTQKLERIFDNSRTRVANSLPLPELAAVLNKTLFVGHDSGISHLAAATGAHSILLFGPTDAAVWAPLNQNAVVIGAPNGDLTRLKVDVVREKLDHELIRIGIST
jgi:heptosyltransferase-2